MIVLIIKEGKLFRERHGKNEDENYVAKLISYDYLDEMVDLIQRVYDALPLKEVLMVDSYDDMKNDMDNGAKVMGIFGEKDQMIAYRYVSFPGKKSHNLGYDVGIPEDELTSLCQLETTVVDPPYRGNNLQSMTLGLMIPIVREEGYKHLACTISPYNYYSVNNIMKHNLKIKVLTKKYGKLEDNSDGLWRYILHTDITEKTKKSGNNLIVSQMPDIDKQLQLLKDGYMGYSLNHKDQSLNYVKFDL